MNYSTLRGNYDPLPETLTKPVSKISKKEGENENPTVARLFYHFILVLPASS